MDFMMNGELQFLKKTVSEEENADVIEEKTQEMESKKEEFLTEETPVEESSPEEHIGDVEEAAAE